MAIAHILEAAADEAIVIWLMICSGRCMQQMIWTIGHSTRSAEEFLNLLLAFNIEVLVDVRTYPGSGKFPHFNKDQLQLLTSGAHISYVHMPGLGGRKKPIPESKNTAWRHEAFRGYADYMETKEFAEAVNELEQFAINKPTAYMCSEAVWWRCHRGLISDYLKVKGWKVVHIFNTKKSEAHPYTSAARIVHGRLTYTTHELFEH